MNNKNDWLDGIKKQIDPLKNTLSEKDYKKYKLRFLLCLAERVTQFSHECGQCQPFQQDISTLSQDISNLIQLADKERTKSYFKSLDKITNHLQKEHKLVKEGYYIGIWMGIGTALGLPFGIPFGNIAIGIPIGIAIGAAIGSYLDSKARKEGRIICPKEASSTTGSTKNYRTLAIVIGIALLLAGLGAFFFIRQFS